MAMELLCMMERDEVAMDTVTYGASISACEKGGEWRRALELFGSMGQSRVEINTITYNAAISACEKGARWRMALELLGDMCRRRVDADAITMNTAITACEKGSAWHWSLWLLCEMAQGTIETDTISFSAAISACEKACEWERALELLGLIGRRKLETDTVTYSAAISACEKGGEWQRALELLAVMGRDGVEPDTGTCSAAISACGRGGEWQRALELLAAMGRGRVAPNTITYSAAISACGAGTCWACALALLGQMPALRLSPTALQYGSVISSLQGAGLRDRALALMGTLHDAWAVRDVSDGPQAALPPSGGGHRSEPALSIAGDFDGRTEVSILREARGIIAVAKPPGVTSQALLEGLARRRGAHGRATAVTMVSRLDFLTSGVLVAALGEESSVAAQLAKAQFAGRLVRKAYICLCHGATPGCAGAVGRIGKPLLVQKVGEESWLARVSPRGKEAHTEYRVLASYAAPRARAPDVDRLGRLVSLLAVRLLTGRTHQIRAHLASVGRPLAADGTYGAQGLSEDCCPRVFLHCRRIALRDASGDDFSAEAALPEDLAGALRRLEPLDAAE